MNGERQQSSSQEWLREVARGSVEAYALFYDQYASMVFRIAFRLTGNKEEAEDICHDVFLSVWHQAARYNAARGSIEAWLYVLTRSRALDLLRRQDKQVSVPVEADERMLSNRAPSDDPTSVQALGNLLRQALQRAFSQLPETQRQAIASSYVEGRTHHEIAERMNRPLGTIKSLIRYGLQKLRKQMQEEGWVTETDAYEGRRSS